MAKLRTWGYGDGNITMVISNKTRYPCIEIVIACSYILDAKIAFLVHRGPELVALRRIVYKINAGTQSLTFPGIPHAYSSL